MKKIRFTFFIIFCSVNVVFTQNNFGFEAWETEYSHIYKSEIRKTGFIKDNKSGKPKYWQATSKSGIIKTNDAFTGKHAIIIHNWYSYANTSITQKIHIKDTPRYISGYYKYYAESNNENKPIGKGKVALMLGGDTLSTTHFNLTTTNQYKYFEVELNNAENKIADSIEITFTNSINTHCFNQKHRNICNFLFLDNIDLLSQSQTNINRNSRKGTTKVYPNPAENDITIITYLDVFTLSI